MAVARSANEPTAAGRIVILGAGGVIGTSLCRQLTAFAVPMLPLRRNDLDLGAPDAVNRLAGLFQPTDCLVILAARNRRQSREFDVLEENLRIVANVCSALATAPVAYVVYASSDAVYPRVPGDVTEDSCAEPSDTYSAMHLAREIMLTSVLTVPMAILRMSQVYAAHDTHDAYGPCRFLRSAADEGRVALFGNGEELRDHIFIDDVVKIFSACLEARFNGLLNVASGHSASFAEVANVVAGMFESAPRVERLPRRIPVTHRKFVTARLQAAFPEFSFTPLEDGIRKMFQEFSKAKGTPSHDRTGS